MYVLQPNTRGLINTDFVYDCSVVNQAPLYVSPIYIQQKKQRTSNKMTSGSISAI